MYRPSRRSTVPEMAPREYARSPLRSTLSTMSPVTMVPFCFTVSVTVPPALDVLHTPARVPETSGTSSDMTTGTTMPTTMRQALTISSRRGRAPQAGHGSCTSRRRTNLLESVMLDSDQAGDDGTIRCTRTGVRLPVPPQAVGVFGGLDGT